MKHTSSLVIVVLFTFFASVSGCATHDHDHEHHNNNSQSETPTKAAQSLHDIWVLISLAGEELSLTNDMPAAQLEIYVADKRVVGFDGCNNFQGSIVSVDDSRLEFGPIMSTRKFCQDMSVSDTFNQKLVLVKSYKREGLVLSLLDEQGTTLMKFKKVD
jgi:heat shock protein HslJ